MPTALLPAAAAALLTAIAAIALPGASLHAAEPGADRPIEEVIDHYIDARLAEEEVQPAPTAEAAALIRRLTLDLAGRIPTVAEATAFAASAEDGRVAEAVERLLASPDFAWHQRNWLDGLLLADKRSDGKFREYLLEAARENRPWDVMFREMVSAEDLPEDRQPAAAFLRERARNVDDMTNDTSQLFFGVSINCAKCHDHPLVGDWLQDHYYGFASFFDRTYLTKKNTLAEKYSGEVKFKTTAGEEKVARLMFLTGAVVEEPAIEKTAEERKKEDQIVQQQMKDDKAPAAPKPEFSPRTQFVNVSLAEENNQFFARSIVNRLWARLTGYGLVHPLDQMHSANPPSHPELMDWLARDLVSHNYDLKRLIRGIVLSRTYARSAEWTAESDLPGPHLFAVGRTRPMSPRQYAISLLIASSSPQQFPADMPAEDWRKKREQLENAANGFASLIERPGENFQVSVDEALLLSNSDRIEREFLRDSGDRLVGYLKTLSEPELRVQEAFLSIFSRPPAEEELAAMKDYLASRPDRADAALTQVVWAMLSSPEMRFVP
ncbi:MAG: DUF1549 domain-containing protein [Planctomycetaceae bacterium]|nr:DUF1549 domain-containing protein [Planctomycetaceae bacterium]